MSEEADKLNRISELMKPVDEQITKCVTGNEQVMLACGMMQRVKEILEHHLGKEDTNKLLEEFVKHEHVS